MGVLRDFGVSGAHHYTPLHYLAFIARSRALLSKPALLSRGFAPSHFRSMSHGQDTTRGFGRYVHLTLSEYPPIARAKLAAGFPHARFTVNAAALDRLSYDLCRYNIAMTRFLRRGDKQGFPPSSTNGRYYKDLQIPVARTNADKSAMLSRHMPAGTMIEVLVEHELPLPDDTVITCFSEPDAAIATHIVSAYERPWPVRVIPPPDSYPRSGDYAAQVNAFIHRAQADPLWRGDGLEFDRV